LPPRPILCRNDVNVFIVNPVILEVYLASISRGCCGYAMSQ
jgi:hypothetical protein